MVAGRFSILMCSGFWAIQTVSTAPLSDYKQRMNASDGNLSTTDEPSGEDYGRSIVIFQADFAPLQTPYLVAIWVLAATLAKTGFQLSKRLSNAVPESCLLILLGVPIGIVFRLLGKGDVVHLSSNLFFYFLLPPIIFDAGYFMPGDYFFFNIGTILLYAVFGTLFNAISVGASLFGVASMCDLSEFSLLRALLFGALISAVDPVAVITVFEEIHVNEVLYILVFGESVLNDATSVVLYHTFASLAQSETNAKELGLAFALFIVSSVGGILFGITFALAGSFMTRFTQHVRVIEPLIVFMVGYLSYLTPEIFHFSGIMSILFCGLVMKPYVESNVSRKSHTTIKYCLKMMSSSSEAVLFMLLGVSLVHDIHAWNATFIFFTLLFITVFRVIGVIVLTYVANRSRVAKVNAVEQFIMSYGGLRGAVAFCLSLLLNEDNYPEKSMITGTTIAVVVFTVFVQGTTMRPIVNCLGVKKMDPREKSVAETLNDRMLGYMMSGIEEIMNRHGQGFVKDLLEAFNRNVLRQWLCRNPNLGLDEGIVVAERKNRYQVAMNLARNPMELLEKDIAQANWDSVRRNPSYALALAMKAQSSDTDLTHLDTRVLAAVDAYANLHSDAFAPREIKAYIPKAKRRRRISQLRRSPKKAYSKYSLSSLEEEDCEDDDEDEDADQSDNCPDRKISGNRLRGNVSGEATRGRNYRRRHYPKIHRSSRSKKRSGQTPPTVDKGNPSPETRRGLHADAWIASLSMDRVPVRVDLSPVNHKPALKLSKCDADTPLLRNGLPVLDDAGDEDDDYGLVMRNRDSSVIVGSPCSVTDGFGLKLPSDSAL